VPKYLITGIAGSGKTTVADALADLGYHAYSTDDLPGVTRFENDRGQPTDWPDGAIDWSIYAWNWQEAALQQLLAGADTVFVAAITSNQASFYHLFEAIFVLIVDKATVRHRLLSRTSHDFGKHPDELAGILSGHADAQRELLGAPRAVAIDATRPLGVVVGEIIARSGLTGP
jgi:gluconate kinase